MQPGPCSSERRTGRSGYRPQRPSAQRCGGVEDAGMNRLSLAVADLARRAPPALRLASSALLVGAVCSLSTELGFLLKFPPHHISPLWPTGAILFSVLVMTPVRHWWVYIVAAYFTSVLTDALAGFPIWALLYIAAGLVDVLIAAFGVRRFAGGVRAFESLRSVLLYVLIAVILAPFLSAFVGAFAGGAEDYWFYWRVWFLSEALAYLTLAPAILACLSAARHGARRISRERAIEAGMIAGGLLLVSIRAFFWPAGSEGHVPALVYLPLPFLLWAAVRFGPAGVNLVSSVRCARVDLRQRRGAGAFHDGHDRRERDLSSVVPVRSFLSFDIPGGTGRGATRAGERAA